ncbi:MAG: imidazole glycerol phosphate synthase subunit HisH, partial [Planctomycetes bacterium]|nr:imidazole glycerol phosphate synthase subunit HisH [Planctomycetota bacterium]
FPGGGSARQCMDNLRRRGFDRVLADAVAAGTPVLAICIGMQLLFDHSEEDGGVDTLGLLPGRVRRFQPTDPAMKVPHMGWNHTAMPRPHPLLPDTLAGGDYYFVHSYYVEPAWDDGAVAHAPAAAGREPGLVYGRTEYAGLTFTAMAGRGSLFASQFHPEKSGETGLDILRRFLQWDGRPC